MRTNYSFFERIIGDKHGARGIPIRVRGVLTINSNLRERRPSSALARSATCEEPIRGRPMTVARILSIARAVTSATVLAVALSLRVRAQSTDSYPSRCGAAGVSLDRGGY